MFREHYYCPPSVLPQPSLTESVCERVQPFSIEKTDLGKGSVGEGITPSGPSLQGRLRGTREVPKLVMPLDGFPVLHLYSYPHSSFLGMVECVPCPCSLRRILALTGKHL